MITYALLVGTCVLNFSLGTFLFVMAMTKIMKQNLNAINESANNKHKRALIAKQFSQFVQYHSMVKQLSIIYDTRRVLHGVSYT